MFVLCASVALRWVFQDENTPAALQILDRLGSTNAIVPAHWWLDVGNTLIEAQRQERLQPPAMQVVGWFRALPLRIDADSSERVPTETLELAARFGLHAFDAAYLELALRQRLSLATFDSALMVAAQAAGVALVVDS